MAPDFKKIEGYIFDFDGTLVDTEPVHFKAFTMQLKKMGYSYVTYEQHCKKYTGAGSRSIFSQEFEIQGIDADLDQTIREKKELYADLIGEVDLKPIPGSVEFLHKVKKAGKRIAVSSGSDIESIKRSMQKAGIPDLIETFVTTDDVEKPKPYPEGMLKAAERLGVDPGKCVVFEDAVNGVNAAMSGGMTPVGVASCATEEKFRAEKEDIFVIKNFLELLEIEL
jgi:HAD superfamily hydrolase (TIGR01509 family)